MIKNYFKIAWRGLAKNKLYTIVNIGGLTAGITCCLLIGLYLSNELNFDRWHKNADRLVRVTTEYTVNGATTLEGFCPKPTGPQLAGAFPEIESFVRLVSIEPYFVRYGDKAFVEPKFLFADSTFFTMFTFPLIEGDARSALDAPRKIVISRSMEIKYFGEGKALGKILQIGGTDDYVVSGVAADAPANSQIQFSFIASMTSLSNANARDWWHHIYPTYFLLRDPAGMGTLDKRIAVYMRQQKDLGQAPNDYMVFHLEPMTRVHLYSSLQGLEPNGNITYIYILGVIALLILGIASVNYTNLATTQSVRRIPEIGIRKVLGSGRRQLFWQFMGESLLLNLIAFILAIWTTILLLPLFDRLVERPLGAGELGQPMVVGGMVLLYLAIGFAAGAYPAVLLSGLKLIKILKTGFSFSGRSGMLRRSLIVFQFMVSVFLIIFTVIILQQLSYIQHKNLGYNKDQLIVLPVDYITRMNFAPIKEALEQVPHVRSVTCGAEEPTHIGWGDEVRVTPSAPPMFINAAPTDIDFVRTLGVQIVAGNDFTRSDWLQADSAANPSDPHTFYMLNESAVKALGWTPSASIGRTLYRGTIKGIVKAVVKNFHYASLHEAIGPLLIFLDPTHIHIYKAFVKVDGSDLSSTLRDLAATWKERVPHRPFEYHFLDESYNIIYHTEQQTARIFTTFSALAILLACLGLFALAAYSTVQRAKEIGIRKVLGAGVLQVVLLICRDFIRLVMLASLIAFPVAWLAMSHWLQSFAYRIDIGWWVFVVAGLAAAMIALMSIGFQVLRAASANPAKILKAE